MEKESSLPAYSKDFVDDLLNQIKMLKLEIKILRQESRDIDIDYSFHEGRVENNELL